VLALTARPVVAQDPGSRGVAGALSWGGRHQRCGAGYGWPEPDPRHDL